MKSVQNQSACKTIAISASTISEGGIIVRRPMIPARQSASSAATSTNTMAARIKLARERRMNTLRSVTNGAWHLVSSELHTQVGVKQTLIDQLRPVDRAIDLADLLHAFSDRLQSLRRDIALRP